MKSTRFYLACAAGLAALAISGTANAAESRHVADSPTVAIVVFDHGPGAHLRDIANAANNIELGAIKVADNDIGIGPNGIMRHDGIGLDMAIALKHDGELGKVDSKDLTSLGTAYPDGSGSPQHAALPVVMDSKIDIAQLGSKAPCPSDGYGCFPPKAQLAEYKRSFDDDHYIGGGGTRSPAAIDAHAAAV